jgi:D-threonate/D-erythronate kinase
VTQVLVVADDLTGANAAAAGFARAGMRAVTVGLGGQWSAAAEFHGRFDVVVVTTGTRHAPPEDVVEAVTGAVRAGWPVDLVSCRIDTTLRGNVGVAAAALVNVVREVSGRRAVGLCMPAHPSAGRQTVDGFQMLKGQRLEQTELARDPRSPVSTSSVADVLREGTELAIGHVPLSVVTGDADDLEAAVLGELGRGADVVVADALTDDHLARVAAAAAAVGPRADVAWVGIDPGPGSAALAAALGIQHEGEGGVLLAVSGSATDLTRVQLQTLLSTRTVHVVRPTTAGDGAVPEVEATVTDLTKTVHASAPGDVVLLATVLTADDVVALDGNDGAALPRALGEITRRTLEECTVDGLYTTGGDVTAAVLEHLGAQGLDVEDEVVPLAVAGEIVDGPWSGLPIVTKGGLVGDADAGVACIEHLARSAALHARRVRTAVPPPPVAPD